MARKDPYTLAAAICYATTLLALKRFEEAKSLLRKMMAVARRVIGDNHELTLRMKWNHADALRSDDNATLGDLHEAVTTLEETTRIARRVLGGAHPNTKGIERALRESRAALSARDDVSAVRGALEVSRERDGSKREESRRLRRRNMPITRPYDRLNYTPAAPPRRRPRRTTRRPRPPF